MSLTVLGKVYLGTKAGSPLAFPAASRFSTDPRITRQWAPSRNYAPNVGGSGTHQEFGRVAKDLTLTLTSSGNWISLEFKKYLDGLVKARGAVYDYKDYQGVEAQVVTVSFEPTPTFVRDGVGVNFDYSLVLHVVSMSVLDFASYTE